MCFFCITHATGGDEAILKHDVSLPPDAPGHKGFSGGVSCNGACYRSHQKNKDQALGSHHIIIALAPVRSTYETHTQHRHAINNLIYFIVLLIYLFMASGMAVDGCVRL